MVFNKNLTHSFQKRTNAIETKNMNKCSKKSPQIVLDFDHFDLDHFDHEN